MTEAFVRKKIREMLAEDLGSGDITSETLIKRNVRAKANIVAWQAGTLAGVKEAVVVFKEAGVRGRAVKSDGARIKAGDVVMHLDGPARKIIASERVALNMLMRMSGIATATRELIERAKVVNPKIEIAATRKTAPLISYFDKRAVLVAGGRPHRYCLSDHILIKDNHLHLAGPLVDAVKRARSATRTKIEVEVTLPDDAVAAAKAGADIVMLDNMKPVEIAQTIKMLKEKGLRKKVMLEASGRIDPSNVESYAATGVDMISSSYMTIRAPALDMSLEMLKDKG